MTTHTSGENDLGTDDAHMLGRAAVPDSNAVGGVAG
jgi:hypothetical protein